ncbi:MAG: acyloxyacyl hydrolase [Desulfuromonadales bacterium]|nr:acyloxyacyl hydrolase [Desulfuromonadales bacterium]
MRSVLLILAILGPLLFARPLFAQDDAATLEPTRYGVALLVGSAYDPHRIGLALVQGQLLLDYDRIAWHAAPQSLRLKFEINAGLTTDGRDRGLLAVNMLALRYLDGLQAGHWTPYIEAGVGVIYTDFQVKGQGLRINFNPQAGAGVEYLLAGGGAVTMALRLHHISNGDTYKDNRGVNSALLMIGYLFQR